MDKNKKLERISKKNEKLSKQLETYKERFETEKKNRANSEAEIKTRIAELEAMRQEWVEIIDELRNCKQEYLSLIQELRVMKTDLQKEGLRPPFYIRLLDRFKRRW